VTVRRAMVLAAGRGQRMRPITDTLPKPLVAVAGRPMIDRILDRLAAAGVEEAVVNAHHLAPVLLRHLEARRGLPAIRVSPEAALLDTGGGVAQALPLLRPDPFYVANSDTAWRDPAPGAFARLVAAWDGGAMDGLLLLCPPDAAFGYDGPGDFVMAPDGRLRRASGAARALVFMGLQILHPRLFADAPEGAFSLNLLYDRALAAGRLFGLLHGDRWYHVGTPQALDAVEAEIARDGGLDG
jgi:MurNAc alpha-1-phosphate uridylyltransferase